MIIILSYSIYIVFSVSFTLWVGHTLHKNGRTFLLESFDNDETKADSINQLLLVGFYLVNFGLVSLFLSMGTAPSTDVQAIEYLSTKIGVVLIVLGGMHYFNMANISKIRSKARRSGLGEYRIQDDGQERI